MFQTARVETSQVFHLTARDYYYLLGPLNSSSQNLTFGVADFRPGESMEPHLHDRQEEIVMVLSGEGEFVTPEGNAPMTPGVAIFIPKGLQHRIAVTGPSVLRIISVFSPPVVPGAYDAK